MAARGINKVILVGNLGADPQIRYTPPPDSMAITNLNVATSRSWKDKTGQIKEETEWHRVVLFNRLAEIANEYLHKGSKVYIEGSLRTRKWKDSNEIERSTTEVVASEMQMLDSRNSRDLSAGEDNSSSSRFTPNSSSTETAKTNDINPVSSSGADFEDDIPF